MLRRITMSACAAAAAGLLLVGSTAFAAGHGGHGGGGHMGGGHFGGGHMGGGHIGGGGFGHVGGGGIGHVGGYGHIGGYGGTHIGGYTGGYRHYGYGGYYPRYSTGYGIYGSPYYGLGYSSLYGYGGYGGYPYYSSYGYGYPYSSYGYGGYGYGSPYGSSYYYSSPSVTYVNPTVLAKPVAAPPAPTAEKIKIRMLAVTDGTVNYKLNGIAYTMQPGFAQSFPNDRSWTITFDDGTGRIETQALPGGNYQFVKAPDGHWELRTY